MKFLLFEILVGFFSLSIFTQAQVNYDLAIHDVDIFDSRNKTVLSDKTVLINGDHIAAIIDASESFTAEKTIAGQGKLLSPGFIDTHVHLRQMLDLSTGKAPTYIDDSYRKKLAQTFLPYGTTTVVDMGQPEEWMDVTVNWKKNPSPDYPNYFMVGGAMISDLAWNRNPSQHHTIVYKEADAIQKVQKYADMEVEHIKLYWKLERSDMETIINEANKQQLNLYAHVDQNIVTIPQAMDLGVNDFEHFFTVTPGILDYEEHWRPMKNKFELPDGNHIDDFSASMVYFFTYIKETPELETRLIDLFDRLAKEKGSISTAIHVLGAAANKTNFFSSFNHFPIRTEAELPDFTSEQKEGLAKAFDNLMIYLKMAHDMGVKIRIGTDNREAGKAMISELMLFAEGGFPMEDVLQIATWNGATSMKIEDRYGSIEVGKKADLVLFDKNPFAKREYLLSQKTVIKGGKVFEPTENIVSAALERIKQKGIAYGKEWINNLPPNTIEAFELQEIAYHLFHIGKISEAQEISQLLIQTFPDFTSVYYEDILNQIGYNLLGENKLSAALTVFKLVVETYPESFNAHDSLGEGYMKIGENALAIKHYEKSIELNPENTNGIDMLKKLKAKN